MNLLPLSPIRFHILLSLARDSAHAALISTRVAYDTFGEVDLRPATLHDNLQVLHRHGWIAQQAGRRYTLTEKGYQVLENDLYRWRIVTSRATDTLRAKGSGVPG
jgi:DNA-binding PadR family transcriptional regulator